MKLKEFDIKAIFIIEEAIIDLCVKTDMTPKQIAELLKFASENITIYTQKSIDEVERIKPSTEVGSYEAIKHCF